MYLYSYQYLHFASSKSIPKILQHFGWIKLNVFPFPYIYFWRGRLGRYAFFFCLPPYCPIIKRHRIYLFLFVYIVYMMCLYLLYTYLQFDRKLFSDRIHRGVFFFYISIHIYFSSIFLTIRQFKEVSSSRTRILVFIFFSIE